MVYAKYDIVVIMVCKEREREREKYYSIIYYSNYYDSQDIENITY